MSNTVLGFTAAIVLGFCATGCTQLGNNKFPEVPDPGQSYLVVSSKPDGCMVQMVGPNSVISIFANKHGEFEYRLDPKGPADPTVVPQTFFLASDGSMWFVGRPVIGKLSNPFNTPVRNAVIVLFDAVLPEAQNRCVCDDNFSKALRRQYKADYDSATERLRYALEQ